MTSAQAMQGYTQHYDTLLYRVQPGDTLSRILKRYHPGITDEHLERLAEQVVAETPLLTTPVHLRPDQLITLKIPLQYCAAPANTQHEKNEIFVETAGGVVGGLLYATGASVAILLMSTPVGWVAGLTIGIGSAVAGYASGKAALKVYDLSGTNIDFVGSSGVGSICAPGTGAMRMPVLSPASLSAL